jgi:PAS domain S-box-containing protein
LFRQPGKAAYRQVWDGQVHSKPTYAALEKRCQELEGEIERLGAERARLLESEQKFRLIADLTGDMVALATFASDPVFTYISSAFLTEGYQAEDLVGKPALSLVHPDDRQRIRSELQRLMEAEENRLDDGNAPRLHRKLAYRFLSPHGKWVPQRCAASPVGTSAILFLSREISERKKAEAALHASEKAYRSIFENTGTATLILEEDTTIGMANSEFARLVGFTQEEIEGKKKWPEFVVPEDLAFMKAYHDKRRRGDQGVPQKYEFRLCDRYGKIRHVSNSVSLIPGTRKSVSSMHDVTQIRRAEAALRESEEKFRTITSHAHDAIIMVTADGAISYCNHAAESMFGYSGQEMTGRLVTDVIGTEGSQKKVQGVFSRASGADPQTVGTVQELTACRKDGSEIQIELSVSSVSIMGKGQALGIIRDISERLRVALQLQQSQKMEAMGTLASGIAHDFNNILGAIFGYCSLVKNKSAGNPKVVAYADEILNAGHRAKKLIRNILTFTRQKKSRKEVVEIDPLIAEAMELLRASIPATIELGYRNKKGPLSLMADPTQIHQIIMNLATNAYHAIGNSGVASKSPPRSRN